MKKFVTQFVLVFFVALPLASYGQTSLEKDPAYLPIDKVLDLKTIHPKVDVNLPRFLLKDALSALSAATNSAQPGGNNLADVLKDIKLIRIVVIERREDDSEALDKAMKELRNQLGKKWTAIVSVPEENVGIYAMPDPAGDSTVGLAVLVYDDGDAVIGNIVGHIALDKLMKMASQKDFLIDLQGLGIPTTKFGIQPTNASELEQVTAPKIIGASGLSADEVLKKALEARGGADVLRSIHSLCAKGHININDCPSCGSIAGADASTIEVRAIRPNKWRAEADYKSSAGQDFGKWDVGFDGRNAWDDEPGAAPKVLTGRPLEQWKEAGDFFAWQEDPAVYESSQCLGEVSFDGKTCYAVKVAHRSGDEELHYYDTNTFLLAGRIYMSYEYYGSSWEEDSYGDYREFGGFKIPTRQAWQLKWSRGVAVYDSIELNGVKESVLQMPAQNTALTDNSNK